MVILCNLVLKICWVFFRPVLLVWIPRWSTWSLVAKSCTCGIWKRRKAELLKSILQCLFTNLWNRFPHKTMRIWRLIGLVGFFALFNRKVKVKKPRQLYIMCCLEETHSSLEFGEWGENQELSSAWKLSLISFLIFLSSFSVIYISLIFFSTFPSSLSWFSACTYLSSLWHLPDLISLPFFPQLVVLHRQLLKKAKVGLHLPARERGST